MYGMDTVEAWKRILDWHRSHGLNTLITQLSSHFKDRTVLGWGFQYVLDFSRHPDARTFSPEFVSRNRRTIREILNYADAIGVRIFLHHYNFMAPRNFVEAHPELFRKWKSTSRIQDVYMARTRMVCDRIGTLYGNLCWREPVYQNFMADLYAELFDLFPTLTGIVTTPGENNYCLCPDCTRGAKDSTGPELLRARNQTAHEFLGDYSRKFKACMEEHHKQGVIRLWGIQELLGKSIDTNVYPVGIPYMIKYHWFDVVDTGPDPIIADWIQRGYEVWVSKELWGENAGPVQWNRPDYIRGLVEQCRRLGVTGLVTHQNNDWGTAGIPGWVQGRNLVNFSRCFQPCEQDDDTWLEEQYRQKFGPAGPEILQAVKTYSDFVFNITKIVKIGGEGYTFGVPHPVYPGVGRIGNRVDPWIRGQMGELADYIDYAEKHGWDSDLFITRKIPAGDPLDCLDRMKANAASAIAALESLREKVLPDALGEFNWILISARLCLHQADEYRHLARVAILRAARLGEKRPETRSMLADWALREMRMALQAVRHIQEDLLELPTSSMDFSRTLRATNPEPIESHRAFYLAHRESELLRLEEEFQAEDAHNKEIAS